MIFDPSKSLPADSKGGSGESSGEVHGSSSFPHQCRTCLQEPRDKINLFAGSWAPETPPLIAPSLSCFLNALPSVPAPWCCPAPDCTVIVVPRWNRVGDSLLTPAKAALLVLIPWICLWDHLWLSFLELYISITSMYPSTCSRRPQPRLWGQGTEQFTRHCIPQLPHHFKTQQFPPTQMRPRTHLDQLSNYNYTTKCQSFHSFCHSTWRMSSSLVFHVWKAPL